MYIQNDYDTWGCRTRDCQSHIQACYQVHRARKLGQMVCLLWPAAGASRHYGWVSAEAWHAGDPTGGELAGLIWRYKVIMVVAAVQRQNASVLSLAREMGKSEQIPDSPPACQWSKQRDVLYNCCDRCAMVGTAVGRQGGIPEQWSLQ
ncbi:hypothetical protein EDB85DRAFT_1894364 [Lactarius pseudohatsudake]|nr:hypothetical protein EDB85DRAFT_1894364 [Lactarius pseudohatsudake]